MLNSYTENGKLTDFSLFVCLLLVCFCDFLFVCWSGGGGGGVTSFFLSVCTCLFLRARLSVLTCALARQPTCVRAYVRVSVRA